MIDGITHLPVSEMLKADNKWFSDEGPAADAVLSTRVRLARNIKGMRFPGRMHPEEANSVILRVESAARNVDRLSTSSLFTMENLSVFERQFLLERHLISYDLASSGGQSGLIFSDNELVSAMVNEEDHVRIQALMPGFQLDECYALANQMDDLFESSLEWAFSDEFGYLTACPTNVGTGLRASVLVHLPALVLTRKMRKVLSGIQQIGLAVRGYYGEGTDVLGNFFQISNQITLGEKETNALLNLERVVRQLMDYEEKAREVLMRDAQQQIYDKVKRALGVFTNAYLLSSDEAIGLASAIRLGRSLGIEGLPKISTLNEILLYSQPAHLQLMAGEEMGSEKRNSYRAKFISEKMRDDNAA
jgi:protein arginine kinase